MVYTKEFSSWYAWTEHIPGLEPWQEARVKAACFRAWLRGRIKLKENL